MDSDDTEDVDDERDGVWNETVEEDVEEGFFFDDDEDDRSRSERLET